MFRAAVKTYLISLIAFIFTFVAIIYFSDPYMLFHKKYFHHGKILDNLRIQNYGIIKYGEFDGIILGTSMLQNTSADEASEKLNMRFANLSFAGASFYRLRQLAGNHSP